MIHISKIFEVVQELKRFSIAWVSERGERIFVQDAEFRSFFSMGYTMNIVCRASGQIRKVNRYSVVEINGEEVFI